MTTLGLNGLGINPAACLVKDNHLLAFGAEERFNRLKESFGAMPKHATAFCLAQAGVSLAEVDHIAFGWNAPLYRWKMPLFVAKTALQYASLKGDKGNIYRAIEQLVKYRPANVELAIAEMLRSIGYGGALPNVFYAPHHLAHAASVYYTSGFDAAHVLVIDGSGENQCTTIYRAEGTRLFPVRSFAIPHSLGWFYQSITEWLGFSPNSHEGKTMALAAYGQPNAAIRQKLAKMLRLSEGGGYAYVPRFSFAGRHTQGNVFSADLVALLGQPRGAHAPINDYHREVAFGAQQLLEEAAVGLVRAVVKDPVFSGNLCLAGGVALNCKMNGVVAQVEGVKQVYVSPVSSDDGSALGAAMLCAVQQGEDPRFAMTHAYYGPSFLPHEIEQVLQQAKVGYTRPPSITAAVAQLLAEGKIVGWFQGGMEIGARALGHRSILAHPALLAMRDKVNREVKNRETWRPFAASILADDATLYLKNPQSAPFMAMAFATTPLAVTHLSAALHIDGTTRPHLVTSAANPRYYELIKAFGALTGVNALLNTSLNTNEEPIVCTPQQALKAFYGSGLDALALGDFLLQK